MIPSKHRKVGERAKEKVMSVMTSLDEEQKVAGYPEWCDGFMPLSQSPARLFRGGTSLQRAEKLRTLCPAPMKRTPRSPIIVVDDSEEDIFLFQLLLKRTGATAPLVPLQSSEAALDWLNTIDKAAAERPFVCFLDVKMPQITGFDLLRSIRARATLQRLPVIMLSSSDDERDVRRAAELGAQAYVQKYPSTGVLSELLANASAFSDGMDEDSAFARLYNLLLQHRVRQPTH